MFTIVEGISGHPLGNLKAKAEGFMPVIAKYDENTKTLEIFWPPEGDSEVYEGICSMYAAKKRLGSIVSQHSKLVFDQIY